VNIGTDKRIIVLDKNHNFWLFKYGEGQRIIYQQASQNKAVIQEGVVDDRPASDFWVDIDAKGTIHLLMYTLSRYLIYFTLQNGKEWKAQILSRVTVRSQTLNDLFLVCGDCIHIFYIVQNAFRRSTEAIVHYIWDGQNWTGNRVWEFPAEDCTRIHQVISHAPDELSIYFSQYRDNIYVMLTSHYPGEGRWGTPSVIFTSPTPFQFFHGLLDQHGEVQYCWGSDYNIYFNGKIISNTNCRNTNPCLSINQDTITCTWIADGIPVQYYSNDSGSTWKANKQFSASTEREFYFLSAKNEPCQILTIPFPAVDWPGRHDHEKSSWMKAEMPQYQDDFSQRTPTSQRSKQDPVIQQLLTRLSEAEETMKQHAYRLRQLEDRIYNFQRSIFNLEAQTKKLNHDIQAIYSTKDQLEAMKYALQSLEAEVNQIKKIIK